MSNERVSAVVLSVLLVVSAATAAVPATAFTSDGGLAAVGNTAGNTSGNDGTTSLNSTDEATTTTTTTTTTTPTTTTTKTGDGTTGESSPPVEKPNPKVSSSLSERVDASGPDADGTGGTDFVQVVVRASPGRSDEVAGLVGTNGGDVQARHEDLVQARVPAAAVEALADSPAVEFVREPRRPDTNEITSEGLSNMDVGTVHDAGYTGENVTVAVVDTGFNVSNPEISDQLVNWRNFSSPSSPRTMSNQSGEHGTATAELVADVAPNASIIAVKVGSEVELYSAIDWLDSKTSTDVVTMSLSWYNVGPLDGTAEMNREINASIRNGTTWFTSAGNDGYKDHWNGTWSDEDGDQWMEFSGSDERMNVTPAGGAGTVSIAISWNDWGGSTEDYDVELVDADGHVLAASNDVQSGTQTPTEYIYEYVAEPAYLRIANYSANGTASFDLFFRGDSDPEYATRARSVTVPGTGRNIVTVGAVSYWDNELEDFSSRGPTIDGRIKPDVVAPDAVTTSVYDHFYGTSASTPYTAGVAALVLDANEGLTPAEVKSRLTSTAVPLHGDEPNNETGYGLVDADGAVPGVTEQYPDRVTYTGAINESDGSPAVNGEVSVYAFDSAVSASNLTDDGGNFSVTATGVNDSYVVGYEQSDTRSFPEDGSPDLQALGIVEGTSSADIGTVTLPDASVLNVTVVDGSGDPVPNAEIEVSDFVYEDGKQGYVSYRAEANTDGKLVVGSEPGIEVEGDVRVMAAPPDGSIRFEGSNYTRIFDVQSDTNVTLTLESGIATVSGQVDDASGEPSANAGIFLDSEAANDEETVYTDSTGEFTASSIETDEPYSVGYYQGLGSNATTFPRDGTADLYVLDRVNTSDDTDLGNFDVPSGSVLDVRVEDEAGNPVPSATVDVIHHRRNTTAGANLWVDSEGYLTAGENRGIEVTGNVTVEVTPTDTDTFVDTTYTRNLTVSSDRTVTVTLEEKPSVTGQIYDADGDQSADDLVAARNRSEYELEVNATGTDGTFLLTGLTPKRSYDLSYYQDETTDTPYPRDGTPDVFAFDRVRMTDDVDLGRLDLPSASVLNVRATDEDGNPVESANVNLRHHYSNATAGLNLISTDADGYLNLTETETRGIEVTGNVSLEITPPWDSDRFVDEIYTRNLTVSGDETVTVTFEQRLDVRADGRDVHMEVTSSEKLSEFTVELEANASRTLRREDFTESVQSDDDYSYRATVSTGSDGLFAVTLVNATDSFGSEETYDLTQYVTVDTHGPNVSVHEVSDSVVSDGQQVSVAVEATDALSDVETVTADASELGGGTFALTDSDGDGVYRGNFTVDASDLSDGNYSLSVSAADAKGNEFNGPVHEFLLDTHAPNVTDPPWLNRTDEILPQHAVEVVVNATDETSSVADVVVSDESIGHDGTGPVPAAPALGAHSFRVVVRDEAGNERVTWTGNYTVGEQVEMHTENGTLEAETNDTNVGEVAIETEDENATDASVTVGTATENPESNKSSPGEAPLYFPQINTTVPNDAIEDASVTLTVERSRVRSKYVVPGTVAFWVEEEDRDTGWRQVNATLLDQTDDTYTYEIDAPHFSTYAITGDQEDAAPNVTAFGPATDSPTPGNVTLSASYSDGYSGVDPANVTLRFDGEDVTGEANVTASGLTFTRNLSAGEYDATLSVTDDAGNSLAEPETVTFTVVNESASGSSNGGDDDDGGSGGGGGSANVRAPSVSVSLTDVTTDSLRAEVTSARAGSPGRVSPSGGIAAGEVTLREIAVRPASASAEPRFFVDASVAATPPSGASAPDAATLGYVTVSTQFISDADLREVGVRFSVPASAVADPGNVVVYRRDGGSWTAVEADVVDERDGAYVLRASASATTTFAVGALRPDLSVTDATVGADGVEPGATVEVTATVENAGEGSGTATAELSVDGEVVATKEVAVPAGESKTVTFEVGVEEPGQHEVAVNGVAAGSVSVAGEATTTTAATTTTTAAADETTTTTEATGTPTTSADGGSGVIPGFGVAPALVALLGGLLVARRLNRD